MPVGPIESKGRMSTVIVYLFGRQDTIPREDSQEALSSVAALAKQYGAKCLLRPNTSPPFGRNVVTDWSTTTEGSCFDLNGLTVRHGIKAEGTLVDTGSAVAIRVADCAVCVLFDHTTGRTVVCHVGLHSIITEAPEQKSVIENALNALLTDSGSGIEHVFADVYLAIKGKNYVYDPNHPQHGENNQRLLERIGKQYGPHALNRSVPGGIRLRKIIHGELRRFGMPNFNITINKHHPFEVGGGGEPLWYSHTREGGNRTGSNMVLVINVERPPR